MALYTETNIIFFIVSHSVLLRMRNVTDKSCRENLNTFYIRQLFSESRAVYEIMWKKFLKPGRPQITI